MLEGGGGGVLNFLDELRWGRLENKGFAIGAALKNVQYLVFINPRPPPIINDRSLRHVCSSVVHEDL